MVWKTVTQTNDPGDATHFGGNDVNKISNLFNAVANVDTVDLDSTTFIRDTRLRLRGSSGSNVVTLRTNAISGASDLIIPNPSGSSTSTILTDNSLATVTGKTIAAWDNNLAGTVALPSTKKWGMIPCGAVTGGGAGVGLLHGFIDEPQVPTRGQDLTNGAYWRYTTSATVANTVTGIRVPAVWAHKEWGLYFRAKVRAVTTTNTRQYIGFSSSTNVPIGTDAPLANDQSGVLIGWRHSDIDINVQVFRNSGTSATGSTPTVTDTGVARGTSGRQYEIWFTSAGNCRVRILDVNGASQLYLANFTTNLPNQALSPSIVYSSSTATAKNFDIYFVEMEQSL